MALTPLDAESRVESSVASRPASFGPLLALLFAHAQMGRNRALRGLGRYGMVGLAIVILMPLGLGTLMGVVFAVLGARIAHHINMGMAPVYLGAMVTLITLAFGFMGGILGGTRQLTWEAYKSYPVRFRTLFFAELAASIGDVIVLAYVVLIVCLGVAFTYERPDLLFWLFLFLAQATLWMLFIQQIIGALAVAAVKRLRVAFLAVMMSTWLGLSLIGRAADEVQSDLRADRLEELQRIGTSIRPWVEALPTFGAARAIRLASRSDWLGAMRAELPMLFVTAILGTATYLLLRREAGPRQASNDSAWALAARWRVSGPAMTIARLHLHHLLSSLQGRFGLVIPLITVVLVKGPLANATAGARWVIPGAVTYLAITAGQLQFNQFGLDGQGVKTLLLLPITMRQILLGKAMAMAAYCAVQYAILFVLLGWMMRPALAEVLGGGLLAACLLVAHIAEGHWISAILPRPTPFHRIQGGGLQAAHLFPLILGGLNATAFGGAYGALLKWAPHALVPAMAGALVLVLVAYRAALPSAVRFVTSRREKLVEVLG